MQYINFILDPKNNYLGQTIEYLKLCGLSIAVAIVIGVVLGALVSRNAFLARARKSSALRRLLSVRICRCLRSGGKTVTRIYDHIQARKASSANPENWPDYEI